ncbi:MAG: hypothetical protein WDW38_003138 [Sanguina aurantia]
MKERRSSQPQAATVRAGMEADELSQVTATSKTVTVRAFTALRPPSSEECEHIYNMYSHSMTSLATPIFKVAMRKSIGLRVRGTVICCSASWLCWYLSSSSVQLTALVAAITLAIVPLLVWLFAWSQMSLAVSKADDMQSIEAFYASTGTGSHGTAARFWVAESVETGGIVGCLAMKRNKEKDEAELRYLAVHHRSTGWEESVEQLLQAAVKHARTSGFKAVFGTVVTGQSFLESCYAQQGFKQAETRNSNGWFGVQIMKLSFKK